MAQRKWSAKAMQRSDALDLEPGVFKKNDPKAIARSLKRSVERSKRRKAEPFRSAMSMLNFFINRGGKNLTAKQKATPARDYRETIVTRTIAQVIVAAKNSQKERSSTRFCPESAVSIISRCARHSSSSMKSPKAAIAIGTRDGNPWCTKSVMIQRNSAAQPNSTPTINHTAGRGP
jgi:Protein of unknown function (DUF3175)